MKLSIITAVYNAERTIGDTLDSVASQDADIFEHIIVDGLSTDRTLQVVEAKRRPFTRIVSERDAGIYDALNKGIRAATGDVIGFIHADDFYPDNHVLSRVMEAFEKSRVDCCYGDHEYVRAGDVRRVVRYWKAGLYREGAFRWGWMPPHPTFYATRDAYNRLGLYDTSFRCSGDYELMLRFMHKRGLSVAYIPAVLMRMRLGGESNRSLRKIARKTMEDVRAWSTNHESGGVAAVFMKNVTKLPQLFVRRRTVGNGAEIGTKIWRPTQPR
jgi:glycosyltransferase